MSKRLFVDLLQSKIPTQLGRFYALSFIIHGLFIFGLLHMDLSPPSDVTPLKHPTEKIDSKSDLLKPYHTRQSKIREEVKTPETNDNEIPANPPVDLTGNLEGSGDADFNPDREYHRERKNPMVHNAVNVTNLSPPKNTKPAPSMQYKHEIKKNPWDIDMEEYLKMYDKPFTDAKKKPFSGFDIKKTTGNYPTIKRLIEQKELPPANLVKIDEMINHFQYDYPLPAGEHPFSIYTEINTCPWNPGHLLLHIGLQGMIVPGEQVEKQKFVVAANMEVSVTFNDKKVMAYRLIGYGSRRPKLGNKKTEWKHNRELKMGQSITTLYELIPTNLPTPESNATPAVSISISYREPVEPKRRHLTHKVELNHSPGKEPSKNFRFAAGVARFGMILKNPVKKDIKHIDRLRRETGKSISKDPGGLKKEFLELMEKYKELLK